MSCIHRPEQSKVIQSLKTHPSPLIQARKHLQYFKFHFGMFIQQLIVLGTKTLERQVKWQLVQEEQTLVAFWEQRLAYVVIWRVASAPTANKI